MQKGLALSLSKGFTLIELLIVIGIIGILAAIVLVGIDPVDKINAANDTKVQRDVNALANGMESYAATHNGIYPIYDANGAHVRSHLAVQTEMKNNGDLKTEIHPPGGYTCGDGGGEYYINDGPGTPMVYCQVKSKKFTGGNAPSPYQYGWAWCASIGRAGPANGVCPAP